MTPATMMARMLQPFQPLLRPVSRLLLRTVRLGDPWQRFPQAVPLERYGAGARRSFDWYLEGQSIFPLASVDELKAWLLGCAYVRDPELFNEVDFWQHPCTFERLRMGDCEDFALWAWAQLVRLGYEAEFVAGRWRQAGEASGHAWVLFAEAGRRLVFDPVIRDAAAMVRPLEEVRQEYVPEVSVDGRLRRYVYGGYFHRLRAEQLCQGPS